MTLETDLTENVPATGPSEAETVALANGIVAASETEAQIYGTFFVAESEFAVTVSAIQEVVNEPKQFTDVPLSPDYLIGLFNLRGVIIPVVDLRTIFGFAPPTADSVERKVAIIEHGEHCFGLLVDRTGDVFNARDAERSVFSRTRGDLRETVVDGVFKLENGKRLVQILDPFELLNLDKLPRVAGALRSALSRKKKGPRKQCISFLIGSSVCAFDMTSIKEIVELERIDNTALASDWTLGAIDLRGSTVPVIDFRLFLGQERTETLDELIESGSKLMVMKIGDNLISLLVDEIDTIISFYDEDLLPFPGVGLERSEIFTGCLCDDDDRMVLLLDHELVISDEHLKIVTRGHSALFNERDESAQLSEKGSGEKRTLLTFQVGAQFALDIDKVNEVISYPDTVMTPPSIPDFIAGMVNLRGELIPIINLRTLYHVPPIEPEETKLLIFSKNATKYAIMVDSVSSIVSITDQNSNILPKLTDEAVGSEISDDVQEAVLLTESDDALMMLDLDAVIARLARASTATDQ
ncbi:MAG: chemotaxis protein CheW [Henriciella sp.]|nr:chemotaxis protein CheW [Henriciella sp.]